ncbi:hypothetical protein COLO4_02510, partial [Corchorus olitorius]
ANAAVDPQRQLHNQRQEPAVRNRRAPRVRQIDETQGNQQRKNQQQQVAGAAQYFHQDAGKSDVAVFAEVRNAVGHETDQAAQQPVNNEGGNDDDGAVDPQRLIKKNGLKMTQTEPVFHWGVSPCWFRLNEKARKA